MPVFIGFFQKNFEKNRFLLVFFKNFGFFRDCRPFYKVFFSFCFDIQLYPILSHSIYLKTKFSIFWFKQVGYFKANGSVLDAYLHLYECLSIHSCICMSITIREKPPKKGIWALLNIVANTVLMRLFAHPISGLALNSITLDQLSF